MESSEAAKGMDFGRAARGLIRSMRPRQWTKNVFVFAALVFDLKLFSSNYVMKSLIGFVVLCMLASAVYLLNDSLDVEADRQHPKKRNRPIARGNVSIRLAVLTAILMVIVGLSIAFVTDFWFGVIAVSYLVLTTLYSIKLKHIVILDVIILAIGFVLRVAGGAELVKADNFSPWLYLCMSLLALLLGFGKRRQELIEVGGKNASRAILDQYNLNLLDQVISIVTGSLLLCYMFYSFSGAKLPPNNTFMLTIPFVMYGIFRYLYLLHVKGEGGAPDELVLKDRPLQIAFLFWALTAMAVIYFGRR
jgi:4-hydroxybenzoate polyprenyltransferase